MGKRAVNIDTAKKAEKALGGKKVPLETTQTGGGMGAETIGKIISHEEMVREHDAWKQKPRGE
jgi:hypothetical protein